MCATAIDARALKFANGAAKVAGLGINIALAPEELISDEPISGESVTVTWRPRPSNANATVVLKATRIQGAAVSLGGSSFAPYVRSLPSAINLAALTVLELQRFVNATRCLFASGHLSTATVVSADDAYVLALAVLVLGDYVQRFLHVNGTDRRSLAHVGHAEAHVGSLDQLWPESGRDELRRCARVVLRANVHWRSTRVSSTACKGIGNLWVNSCCLVRDHLGERCAVSRIERRINLVKNVERTTHPNSILRKLTRGGNRLKAGRAGCMVETSTGRNVILQRQDRLAATDSRNNNNTKQQAPSSAITGPLGSMPAAGARRVAALDREDEAESNHSLLASRQLCHRCRVTAPWELNLD